MRHLKILSISLALLTFGFTISGGELIVKSIFNGKMELKVPVKFTVMSDDLMKMKYPANGGPQMVYTNENATINLGVTLTENNANQEMIEYYRDGMVKTFKSAHPTSKWIGNGIEEINGRKVGYIELITPASDTEVYNLMFFTDMDGQLLICSFNCTVKNQTEWSPIAHEMMNSLVLIE